MKKRFVKGDKPEITTESVCDTITERMIELLKSGHIPWKKPWGCDSKGNPCAHRNMTTNEPYKGINIMITTMSAMAKGYKSCYWLTFKQAKDLGGFVKGGEKGTTIYKWNRITGQKKDAKGNPMFDDKGMPIIFSFFSHNPICYTIFNLEQIEGVSAPAEVETEQKSDKEKIEICENIISNFASCPSVSFGGNRACYSPMSDAISMPRFETFVGSAEYYSTFFHEIVHSTGHKSRLNREGVTNFDFFGSHQYSKEELVAEMGASFLCAHAGIVESTLNNSAGYIQSWIRSLNNDPAMVLEASRKAQKAFNLVLGIKAESEKTESTESKNGDLSLVA